MVKVLITWGMFHSQEKDTDITLKIVNLIKGLKNCLSLLLGDVYARDGNQNKILIDKNSLEQSHLSMCKCQNLWFEAVSPYNLLWYWYSKLCQELNNSVNNIWDESYRRADSWHLVLLRRSDIHRENGADGPSHGPRHLLHGGVTQWDPSVWSSHIWVSVFQPVRWYVHSWSLHKSSTTRSCLSVWLSAQPQPADGNYFGPK